MQALIEVVVMATLVVYPEANELERLVEVWVENQNRRVVDRIEQRFIVGVEKLFNPSPLKVMADVLVNELLTRIGLRCSVVSKGKAGYVSDLS